MKNTFSIELKIIVAAALTLLTIATVVVLNQVFAKDYENVKFVYNSSSEITAGDVNISEIFDVDVNN